jgi:hypothetical protein
LKPEWWGSPLAQEQKYQGRKKKLYILLVSASLLRFLMLKQLLEKPLFPNILRMQQLKFYT